MRWIMRSATLPDTNTKSVTMQSTAAMSCEEWWGMMKDMERNHKRVQRGASILRRRALRLLLHCPELPREPRRLGPRGSGRGARPPPDAARDGRAAGMVHRRLSKRGMCRCVRLAVFHAFARRRRLHGRRCRGLLVRQAPCALALGLHRGGARAGEARARCRGARGGRGGRCVGRRVARDGRGAVRRARLRRVEGVEAREVLQLEQLAQLLLLRARALASSCSRSCAAELTDGRRSEGRRAGGDVIAKSSVRSFSRGVYWKDVFGDDEQLAMCTSRMDDVLLMRGIGGRIWMGSMVRRM